MQGAEFYEGIHSAEQQARRSHRLLIFVIMILAIATAIGGFYIFRQIEHQVELQAAAASDNRTWVIAQLEVDLTKYSLILSETMNIEASAEHLEELRERFDILYSRVLLLKSGTSLNDTGMETLPAWLLLSADDGLLERYIPVIDGPDDALLAAVPEMASAFEAIRSDIRAGVVDAVFSVMGRGDILRNQLRDTLRMFTAATLWLILGMAALMVGLFLQSRSRTIHARALEYALQNMRTTINSALDAVLIVNGEGRVVGSNSATVALFGCKLESTRPRLEEILRESDDGVPSGLASLRPGMRVRKQGVRSDGTTFPAEASVGMGRTVTGRAITVIFLRDISAQLAHEESLAQARNDAMAADNAKARFLAVMSHEMRTPLTGLLSALDLLVRTTKQDETQVWLSDIIRTCGKSALEQVNNVLHLSRMNDDEASQYRVASFSLGQALTDITRPFEPDAARSETSIELVNVQECKIGVSLPLQLLHRALGNLLSNAVKFTERGHIRVRLETSPAQREGWVSIRISVEDTGIGIAKKDLEFIFRNFETLDSSYARVREGSGLGLGIAKLAVEEMGGHIETESELGKGSCFTIVMDAPMAEIVDAAPEPDTLPESPLSELSVLLAEDNAINRTLMARQLEGLGTIVTTAVDGQDAVEKAMATCFDLILMDVSMPRLDGLSATRLIREKGICRNVPIIAITAQASPERREEYYLAGMTDVVTKPARINRLVEIMLKHAARAPAMLTRNPERKEAEQMPITDESLFASLIEDLGPEFVSQTVATFRSETDKALDQTRKALEARDLGAVRLLAHKSAGAAAALGLCALNHALLHQENAAMDGDHQTVTRLQGDVEQLYVQSMEQIDRALALA